MSRDAKRGMVSALFAFFLSLFLLFGSVLVVFRMSMQEKTFIALVRSNDYYSIIAGDIHDRAYDYTLPTGIEPSVLDDVFSPSELKNDIELVVKYAFSGKEYQPDTTDLIARLTANVEAYFTADEIPLNDDTYSIITAYCDDIAEIYRNQLVIVGLDYVVELNEMYMRYYNPALHVTIVLSIFMLFLCIMLHKHTHRSLRYVAYSTGGTAIMLFALPFILYRTESYKRISLSVHSLYYIVTGFLEQMLMRFMYAALVWTVVTLLLILAVYSLKNQLMNSDSKYGLRMSREKVSRSLSDSMSGLGRKLRRLWRRIISFVKKVGKTVCGLFGKTGEGRKKLAVRIKMWNEPGGWFYKTVKAVKKAWAAAADFFGSAVGGNNKGNRRK